MKAWKSNEIQKELYFPPSVSGSDYRDSRQRIMDRAIEELAGGYQPSMLHSEIRQGSIPPGYSPNAQGQYRDTEGNMVEPKIPRGLYARCYSQ